MDRTELDRLNALRGTPGYALGGRKRAARIVDLKAARKGRILEYLRGGRQMVLQISKDLDIPKAYVLAALKELKLEGKVCQQRRIGRGGGGSVDSRAPWMLSK